MSQDDWVDVMEVVDMKDTEFFRSLTLPEPKDSWDLAIFRDMIIFISPDHPPHVWQAGVLEELKMYYPAEASVMVWM